ncbi:MAG: competence/damage-inducible protein A [Bacteroidia bacterium]
MKAEIITIGDELLIGQVIDTNSAWIASELNKIGVEVNYRIAIGDNKNDVIQALHDAEKRSNIICITGGLGPTKDDVTKDCLCEYFECGLVQNKQVLDWVTDIFKRRNLPLLEANLQQSFVPEKCEVLFNHNGTAPGMWFAKNNCVFISMPGVPFEMKGIFTQYALPKIKNYFKLPAIYHRTIQTISIGESFLAQKLESIENNLPKYIKLAYLPSVGAVRLRLSAYGEDYNKLEEEVNEIVKQMYETVGTYIFGEGDDTIQQTIGVLLKGKQATLSTAESCTGGYISHLITTIPGSSEYYTGSIVCYDNKIKINELNVGIETLKNYGAVSEQCVTEMANGIRKKYNTTYAIATSGIAGPGGGTADKPVGTVWIAVCNSKETIAKTFNMGDNRERTIQRTALSALDMLRKLILREVDNKFDKNFK